MEKLFTVLSSLFLSATFLTTFNATAQTSNSPAAALPKHTSELKIIDTLLANHHFKNQLFDDKKSSEALDMYLEFLDYGKYLFTQSEINEYKKYQNLLDDFVHKGDLDIPFQIHNNFVNNRQKRIEWSLNRLEQPFDENSPLTLETDREKVGWALNQQELEQRWEKALLNEWISLRLAKQSAEKATNTLKKRYQNQTKKVNQTKPNEIFQTFANAIGSVYDPHTNYFSPRSGEDFNIDLSLSLEGIGAQLTIEEEIITISELIAGGPAKKSGKLTSGDKIIGVGQGEKGEIEDVVGWNLYEAVRLIRGKRGSIVRLLIQKGKTDEITEVVLIRDKIKLEEQAAKSEIKTIEKHGKTYKIGVIELPSFYIDIIAANKGEKDYRSTTRDIKKLITELKKENIDGLMIDLRGNGGGSLAEVISLTGLFFNEGPVVQVRNSANQTKIHVDSDSSTFYNGPLAVLIDGYSASASEIFAGAIKDYGRGIVLGGPTFGKGTVQSVIGLESFLPSIKDQVGQLKMTIAMFYRINGDSTQLRGVKPDLYIPNIDYYEKGGESESKHALPWEKIKSANYQPFHYVSPVLQKVKSAYKIDNEDNPIMDNLLKQHAWNKEKQDETIVSLSYQQRTKEKKENRSKSLQFQNTFRKLYNYPLLEEDYLDKKELEKTEAEKDDDEKYEVDAILDISVETMSNYINEFETLK